MKGSTDTPSCECGFTLIEVLIVLAMIGIIVSVPITGQMRCSAQWERSGMKSEWGLFTGCLVEVEPGRWLPSERIREIDLPRKK
jgi:prepilin-type N-terminal cleavage/methylation domain-containing protein